MTHFSDLRHGYTSSDGRMEMSHLNDVPWWESPVPPRLHRCFAQTTAWVNFVDLVERCACGAIRYDGKRGHWIRRNDRRR